MTIGFGTLGVFMLLYAFFQRWERKRELNSIKKERERLHEQRKKDHPETMELIKKYYGKE